MQNLLLIVLMLSLSSQEGVCQNTATFAQGRLPRVVKSTMSAGNFDEVEKYIGQWKMSSWNGVYKLFEDGRCTLENPAEPGIHSGIWFLAYNRLYLVWSWGPVDYFKLNPDNHTVLQRADHEIKNVIFEKKIN